MALGPSSERRREARRALAFSLPLTARRVGPRASRTGGALVCDDEDDNCLTSSGTIRVTGLPDLVVTAVSVKNAPLTVARGGSLIITVSVKNVGEGDAAASTTKLLLVNAGVTPNLNGTVAAPLLRGNTANTVTKTVSVLSSTPPGIYAVRACADSLDVVVEASEDNCLDTGTTVTVQ